MPFVYTELFTENGIAKLIIGFKFDRLIQEVFVRLYHDGFHAEDLSRVLLLYSSLA